MIANPGIQIIKHRRLEQELLDRPGSLFKDFTCEIVENILIRSSVAIQGVLCRILSSRPYPLQDELKDGHPALGEFGYTFYVIRSNSQTMDRVK